MRWETILPGIIEGDDTLKISLKRIKNSNNSLNNTNINNRIWSHTLTWSCLANNFSFSLCRTSSACALAYARAASVSFLKSSSSSTRSRMCRCCSAAKMSCSAFSGSPLITLSASNLFSFTRSWNERSTYRLEWVLNKSKKMLHNSWKRDGVVSPLIFFEHVAKFYRLRVPNEREKITARVIIGEHYVVKKQLLIEANGEIFLLPDLINKKHAIKTNVSSEQTFQWKVKKFWNKWRNFH